jgi:hypothetical protein
MKKRTWMIAVCIFALIAAQAMAQQGHDSHGSGGAHDMKSGKAMAPADMGGTFKHTATEGGVDAEFQVMSLADMNMTSDKGQTHHIMVSLTEADGGAPIKDAVGKIKVIAPDKTEQVSPLENYSGILAANFTFSQSGKYGVICLVRSDGQNRVFKFWYPHM